jgi:hypothetical protein
MKENSQHWIQLTILLELESKDDESFVSPES